VARHLAKFDLGWTLGDMPLAGQYPARIVASVVNRPGFEEAPSIENGASMRKSPKFSPEVQERAVRMVFDAKDQYPSQWAAIESIAGKIGCTAETLRKWVRQGERDSGVRPGATTTEQQRIKDLEREVRELRKTNEILKLASAYFAQAELDRHHRK
jgi:transposase